MNIAAVAQLPNNAHDTGAVVVSAPFPVNIGTPVMNIDMPDGTQRTLYNVRGADGLVPSFQGTRQDGSTLTASLGVLLTDTGLAAGTAVQVQVTLAGADSKNGRTKAGRVLLARV